MGALILIMGVALGTGCGLLFMRALRAKSFKAGGIAIFVSFFAISAGIFAARAFAPEVAIPAGVLTVLVFLAFVVVAGIRMRD